MQEQSTNHISLKNRLRCYVKSPTAQDVFRPIPGLISYTGVTRRGGLLSHARNAVRWLVLSKRLVEALWRHLLLMQLSFIACERFSCTWTTAGHQTLSCIFAIVHGGRWVNNNWADTLSRHRETNALHKHCSLDLSQLYSILPSPELKFIARSIYLAGHLKPEIYFRTVNNRWLAIKLFLWV